MAKFVFQGVDYIRLTSNEQGPFWKWDDVVEHEFAKEDRAGRRVHFRWMLGYYGRVGEHCFLGKNERGCMVQASGALADEWFHPLSHGGGKCTRIDLQITSSPPSTPDDYLRSAYHMLCMHEKGRGRPQTVQMNDTNYGAKMVTLGARQSQIYGRIYDKGKESKMPEWEGYIRHEIEVKEEQAQDLHSWLREDLTRVHTIKAVVGNYFGKRGCPMYWDEYETREMPAVTKRSRTDETKIAWLSTQVAPTVRDLMKRGKEEEIARALFGLGCSDSVVELVVAALKLNDGG